MKGLKIVVLAKQVPDTRNVGKDAMKADGTVNRAALPAIFNPEDLNALEQALRIKDKIEGTTVHILTMGPGRAAEIIREAMYRGADGGYSLACALRNLQTDLLICGRQAIDGDTAQVGPQVAEKLGLPQVTYAEDILDITAGKITIKRRLERGIEVVECPVPCVVTVNGSAAPCRPRNARYVMKYKYARATQEMQDADEEYHNMLQERPYLKITEWSVNDITCEAQELGLSGSPTKVKNIESVVFQAKEAKVLEPSDTAIDEMMKELIVNHTVG